MSETLGAVCQSFQSWGSGVSQLFESTNKLCVDPETKCMDPEGEESGRNWEVGIDIYTLLILCIK